MQPQESEEDSGNEYDLYYEPRPAPTLPGMTHERHAESKIEPEPGHQSVEQRVGAAVPFVIPAQSVGGDQQEELGTPVENLSGEGKNLSIGNLLDDHSPNASSSSSAAAAPEVLLPPATKGEIATKTHDL